MNPTQHQHSTLAHHHLRVYHYARALAALVHKQPIANRELRSQSQRAAISVALNIAEGAALTGNAKKRHYNIARGSTLEVCAAYEIASDIGEDVTIEQVSAATTAIASMLTGLIR